MKEGQCGLFPDSVTSRGTKQVRELFPLVQAGARATILYLIQREDVDTFDLERTLDPVYAQVMTEAHTRGIESLAYKCSVSCETIAIKERVPLR
jgi:sugar fermentation stimulation protein A